MEWTIGNMISPSLFQADKLADHFYDIGSLQDFFYGSG